MLVTLQANETAELVQSVAPGKSLGIRACGYPDGTVAVVVRQLDGTEVARRDFHLESMDGPYWSPVADGAWVVAVAFTPAVDTSSYGLCEIVEA